MGVAEMTEAEIERQQVECVFGLGGGGLADPADPKFPDDFDCFAYWYEGVPEYLESEYLESRMVYRTAIICEIYGYCDTPPGWTRVERYANSGERDCWWCGPGTDWEGSDEQDKAHEAEPRTNTGYRGDPTCRLCEGGGYVYLGEGYGEVVYTQPPVDFQVEEESVIIDRDSKKWEGTIVTVNAALNEGMWCDVVGKVVERFRAPDNSPAEIAAALPRLSEKALYELRLNMEQAIEDAERITEILATWPEEEEEK